MARRKGTMPPPSGSHTGPFSPKGFDNGSKALAVGHTAAGRPRRKFHRGGKKRRG
jgi:hypothetical protein